MGGASCYTICPHGRMLWDHETMPDECPECQAELDADIHRRADLCRRLRHAAKNGVHDAGPRAA